MKEKRRGGPAKAVAALVKPLTRQLFEKRGFAAAEIVGDWAAIVGDKIAAFSAPQKIDYDKNGYGVLHLLVGNGALATQLMHDQPRILQRINTHFGYPAVHRIRIVNGPMPRTRKPTKPRLRPLKEDEAREIDDVVSGVTDPELRAVLSSLGRSVKARRS